MSLSEEPLATYRTSRLQRWGALLAAGGALLVFGIQVASPRPLFSWRALLQQIPTGGAMIAAAAYGLQARIEVFETGLREVRPLWWDRIIRFETVQRALLPLTDDGIRLFTGSGHQLEFGIDGNGFERSDQLIRQIVRLLPEETEVEDPAGRLNDR
ncbi:MAG: hypothetical protein ABEL97_07140 [Salinibacter sp.]